MNIPTIGFIHSGSFYHLACLQDPALRAWDIVECYARDIKAKDLDRFDALFLADRQHPGIMDFLAPFIIDYLQLGGRRAFIGAENHIETWLPGVSAEARTTNYWSWRTGEDAGQRPRNTSHYLWNYLDNESTVWHYHGVLFPPAHAVSLVGLDEGMECEGSLLYYDDCSYPSALVASTMDPSFHHGLGFMTGATQLLYRIIRWLGSEQTPPPYVAP